MVELLIQRMRTLDLDEIMAIEVQSFSSPWHRSSFMRDIINPMAYYVVARLDERVVGYAGMWVIWGKGHITTLAVHPMHRRKKIGERLLVNLLEEGYRRKLRRMTLEVRESNIIAQCLYKKYGFNVVGVRRGYYLDNNEDAIIMEIKDLRSGRVRERFEGLKAELEEQLEC